jgi:putative ABC transport system permease protein
MSSFWQDLRYGVRMLWKHRLASLMCITALGLGIGANTAIFSVAEGFLLHPVPFEHADRLVALVDSRPEQGIERNTVAPATYLDWREQAKSFDQLAAYEFGIFNLTGNGEPERVDGSYVQPNFFDMLGVRPILGRSFLAEEEVPGKNQEIILGHSLWEQRYASDPGIVGKNIQVDSMTYTVVGVMGPGLEYPQPSQVWVPLSLDPKQRTSRNARQLWVLGKLKRDVPISEARAEMQALAQRQGDAYPDSYKGWQLRVLPIAEFATDTLTRQFTFLLLGAVGFVLLIACADVANVQFARISGRQKELALRATMGASRLRIISQLLTENVLLALAGAAVGLLLARWEITLIVAYMPADVSRHIAGWNTIALDSGALVFTLAIAAFSGILSGIAPSLLSSRTNLSETLKEGGRGTSAGVVRHRLRNALVVTEIALSLVLLVGASLLTKGFRTLLVVNRNLHPETLLTLNFLLPEQQYSALTARTAFRDQILQRLEATPGIKSAAMTTAVPYADGGGIGGNAISIEGAEPLRPGEIRDAILQNISPTYFRTLNIALRDGRAFNDADSSDSLPVAVVSKSMVDRHCPGQKALGRRVKIGKPEDQNPWLTVVGVVDDVRYTWIDKSVVPTLYLPYRQRPRLYSALLIRTEGDPLSVVSAVRAQFAAVDASLPLSEVKSLSRVISESVIGLAYVAAIMGVLGIIALVLASVGVFGVMSYSVSERTHEIGIRMALGASARGIVRLVLGNGMLLTLIGMAIGLPLALGLAYALSSLLFGVKANDPFSFVGLPVILAAAAALASLLPVRRAVRVDPLVALRHE